MAGGAKQGYSLMREFYITKIGHGKIMVVSKFGGLLGGIYEASLYILIDEFLQINIGLKLGIV